MMRPLRYAVLVCVVHSSGAAAYEVATHEKLSNVAARSSVLADPAVLERVGFARDMSVSDRFLVMNGQRASIAEVIQLGARLEDEGNRPVNHFFNPLSGSGLAIGGGEASPDWALGVIEQEFSYANAKQYFYNALTGTSRVTRDDGWLRTFRAIGHVIHHLQDMAQPQHARNDMHCNDWKCLGLAVVTKVSDFYHPSRYERWAKDFPPDEALMSGYPATYVAGQGAVFTQPREFWMTTAGNGTTGMGIAEYTNRGFLSTGTLGDPNFPSPQPGFASYERATDVCAQAVAAGRPDCGGTAITETDYMSFFSNEVVDTLRSSTRRNSRAVSRSVFDEDLERQGREPIYALNRFNFDAAYEFLLPRAVGYSAGLINFFFRGKLDISLPDEGIYAAVDHLTTAGSTLDTGGFNKIKLKLRNLTPGGTDSSGNLLTEVMPAGVGSLVAVVKFHRNTCYRPDLSGEYGSLAADGTPLVDWAQCRSNEESIVVSDPVPTPAGINEAPQPLAFHFPNRVPINATDVFLQVVYRGPLGEEADAVVVTTKDISEPSYIYSLPESYDQFTRAAYPSFEPGDYGWEEWCAQGGMTLAQCNDDYGNRRKWRFTPNGNYDPANYSGESRPISEEAPFDPVLSASAHVGKYGRVAVLTDVERPAGSPYPNVTGPYYLYLRLSESGITNPETFNWNWGGFRVTENQLDPATGTLTPSVTYQQARGVFLYSGDHAHFLEGNASNVPPLEPIPTTINFPD